METSRACRFLLLFMAFVPFQMTAQDFATSPHYWYEGDLTWDDFLGEPKKEKGKSIAGLILGYDQQTAVVKRNATSVTYLRFVPFCERYDSWALDTVRTEYNLLYYQTIFDIAELYCRKATKELFSSSNQGSADEVLTFFIQQMNERVKELEEKTDTGAIYLALLDYQQYIREDIERETFDPFPIVDNSRPINGLGLYLGYSLRAPLHGEFTPLHGLTLGYEFPRDVITFGLALNGEGLSHSNVRFDTFDGTIYQGEKTWSGSFEAYFGYNAYRNDSFAFTPFIGGGYTYFYGESYPTSSNQSSRASLSGFTYEAGLSLDIITSSNFVLFSGGRVLSNSSSLRLRPYVSFVRLRHDLGWLPTFNLSVSYNFINNN